MITLYRWLYSILLYVLIPIEILRLLNLSRKSPLYRKRWSERFGINKPAVSGDVIWFHTVSVGETLAAVPLIEAVIDTNPEATVLVTTLTPTGSEQVYKRLGDKVVHCYAPYDLPHLMSGFINHLKPSRLFIMETELWPNMLHYAYSSGVRIVLMNARMSAKSAKGYARFRNMSKAMLQQIDKIAVQNKPDAERFRQLGVRDEQLQVTGNIKYDLKIPLEVSQTAAELRKRTQQRPIWLAASTHAGEDEILIKAHKKLLKDYPQAMLILVPRHPERFDSAYELCLQSGCSVFRRTESADAQGEIYLADTMGELLIFCALSDAVFIGGSLIEHGGHNTLEAAAFKKPVMSGPHDHNFLEVNRQLTEANALARVASANEIKQQLVTWFTDNDEAERAGEAGYKVVLENRGALDRTLQILNVGKSSD